MTSTAPGYDGRTGMWTSNGKKGRWRNGSGVGAGIAIGVALGAAIDDVGVGSAIGIAIG